MSGGLAIADIFSNFICVQTIAVQKSLNDSQLIDALAKAARPSPPLVPGHDDITLWNAFRSGDEKALVAIFDQHARMLFNYGKKVTDDGDTIKDAIQDLFLDLWKNRETLGGTDSIKFYLLKSLRRKLVRSKLGAARSIFRKLSGEHDVEISHAYEFVLIAEQMVLEQKQKLMRAIGRLTKRQREAIFLRYFDLLNYDQVASVMNLSRRRVYNLIHEAIEQLRKHLSLWALLAMAALMP